MRTDTRLPALRLVCKEHHRSSEIVQQTHLLRIWQAADVTVLFITHDLEEAIYLSDRIVVLGARPGRILEIIDVPVPRPRSLEQFLSGHFLATKKRLEDLIHRCDSPLEGEGEREHG